MSATFDLLTEGWCPVRWVAGKEPPEGRKPEDPISVRELFLHAHKIVDVQVSPPPAAVGVLRVLLARMTKLNEISNSDEWSDGRDELLRQGELDPNTVNGYFDKYRGRCDLFHPEYPFLQDPRLAQQCRNSQGELVASGVNKLVLGRAARQAFVWRSQTWRWVARHRADQGAAGVFSTHVEVGRRSTRADRFGRGTPRTWRWAANSASAPVVARCR